MASRFQISLEWGVAALDRVPADLVVLARTGATARGGAHAPSRQLLDAALADSAAGFVVDAVLDHELPARAPLTGDERLPELAARVRAGCAAPGRPATAEAATLRPDAIARLVLAAQERLGDRVYVSIVCAGDEWPDGSPRFSVGDQLVAGAVVDALADAGVDFHDPACAVASAAYTGLRGAVRHLVSASAAR